LRGLPPPVYRVGAGLRGRCFILLQLASPVLPALDASVALAAIVAWGVAG
jgi:hypothetical protein